MGLALDKIDIEKLGSAKKVPPCLLKIPVYSLLQNMQAGASLARAGNRTALSALTPLWRRR